MYFSPFFLSSLLLLLTLSFSPSPLHSSATAPPPPPPVNLGGFPVFGQWNGRTDPNVQWSLQVTRQIPLDWGQSQQLVYDVLLPTLQGPAPLPSYTAYEEASRYYFATASNNATSSIIWGIQISYDTNNSTRLQPDAAFGIPFSYPVDNDLLVGLHAYRNGNALSSVGVIAFYQSGNLCDINYLTGESRCFADVANDTQVLTSAIDMNSHSGEIYMIVRETRYSTWMITTYNINTHTFLSSYPLGALKNFVPTQESIFEMVFIPHYRNLIVMATGAFDQILYLNPKNGDISFAALNMAEFAGYGDGSVLGFTSDTFLMELDTFNNAALDPYEGYIWFQCSSTDTSSGFVITSLCNIPIPWSEGVQLSYIDIGIAPMTYGYVGMQWVEVVGGGIQYPKQSGNVHAKKGIKGFVEREEERGVKDGEPMVREGMVRRYRKSVNMEMEH